MTTLIEHYSLYERNRYEIGYFLSSFIRSHLCLFPFCFNLFLKFIFALFFFFLLRIVLVFCLLLSSSCFLLNQLASCWKNSVKYFKPTIVYNFKTVNDKLIALVCWRVIYCIRACTAQHNSSSKFCCIVFLRFNFISFICLIVHVYGFFSFSSSFWQTD